MLQGVHPITNMPYFTAEFKEKEAYLYMEWNQSSPADDLLREAEVFIRKIEERDIARLLAKVADTHEWVFYRGVTFPNL